MFAWFKSALSGLTLPSLISWPALALTLLVGIGCYGWGHSGGYGEAEAKGKADLATLRAAYSEGSTNATVTALQRLTVDVSAANRIASDLATARAELATARADMNRRIANAVSTADPACVFGPELVGLCREAFYGVRTDALPEGSYPVGAAAGAGEAASLVPRLRRGASVADLMAWLRDMGSYVRDLEGTSAARRKLLETWTQ